MKILTSAEFKNELSHVLQRVKQGNAANWYEAKISARFVDMGPGWLIYPTYVMPYALGIPMTLVSGLGVMWAIVRRRREGVLMLAWIVPYGFLVSCVSWPLVRYLIPLIPFFTILGACALMNVAQRLQEWLKPGTSRFIVATVCTFVFMHLFANSLAYNSLMTGDDSRINALEWINTRIPKGSTIGMMKYNWTMPPLSKWGGEKL
jgi:hypothetical protein